MKRMICFLMILAVLLMTVSAFAQTALIRNATKDPVGNITSEPPEIPGTGETPAKKSYLQIPISNLYTIYARGTVKKETLVIGQVKASRLPKIYPTGNEKKEVLDNVPDYIMIDVSVVEKMFTGVELNAATMSVLLDSIKETGTPAERLVIRFSQGDVSYDMDAVRALVNAQGKKPVRIIFYESGVKAVANQSQRAEIGENDISACFVLYTEIQKKQITDFDGGEISVYLPKEMIKSDTVSSWAIPDEGSPVACEAQKDDEWVIIVMDQDCKAFVIQ